MKDALNTLVEEAKSLLDSGRLGEALEASEIALKVDSRSSLAWKWKVYCSSWSRPVSRGFGVIGACNPS